LLIKFSCYCGMFLRRPESFTGCQQSSIDRHGVCRQEVNWLALGSPPPVTDTVNQVTPHLALVSGRGRSEGIQMQAHDARFDLKVVVTRCAAWSIRCMVR
jgi:hypothetical protein